MKIRQQELEHLFHHMRSYDDIVNEVKLNHISMLRALDPRDTKTRKEIESIIEGTCNAEKSKGYFETLFFNTDESRVNPLVELLCHGFSIGLFYSLTGGGAGVFKYQLSSLIGSIQVRQGRWNKVTEIKQRLLLLAESKWFDGCLLLHNEMASELLDIDKDAARWISRTALMAALKPIATKYGKVRGLKGIRKEKIPPK